LFSQLAGYAIVSLSSATAVTSAVAELSGSRLAIKMTDSDNNDNNDDLFDKPIDDDQRQSYNKQFATLDSAKQGFLTGKIFVLFRDD
jgi:hypothetical protein